ncbi:MAG: SLBB domain-containing protein, partial [Candidatus Competibacterales bacterium]
GPLAAPNLPPPLDYILGPGDNLIIQLYGASNVEYDLVVQREGTLLLPELGPVNVAGLTFGEAKGLLASRLTASRRGVEVAVTTGELRSVGVLLLGEVTRPGSYAVDGLSTVLNALNRAGGIAPGGSLRAGALRRRGVPPRALDLYDLLLRGDPAGDVALQDGDVLFVPPVGTTVAVAGEVKRPAIYELASETTVAEAIALAGGPLPTAALGQIQIERVVPSEGRVLVDVDLERPAGTDTPLADGDVIRVLPTPRRIDNAVVLTGPVLQPGSRQFYPGMRVSDLLPSTALLLSRADLGIALLRRESLATRRVGVRYVALDRALARPGSGVDPRLQPRDQLQVFDLERPRAAQTRGLVDVLTTQAVPGVSPPMVVELVGRVRFPGLLPLDPDARLLDIVALAGGPLADADRRYGLIARREWPGERVTFLSFDLVEAQGQPRGPENLVIFPRDRVYLLPEGAEARRDLIREDVARLVAQTPYGEASRVVTVSGAIRVAGRYPLEPGMRIGDLLRAGGGLRERSSGVTGELTRYRLAAGELRRVEHVTVDLDALLAGRSGADRVLQPFDHLLIHPKPQWDAGGEVVLAGEVRFPGRYPIARGESLCQVLQRAGGLQGGAYPFGAVFTRERVRVEQQRALDRLRENMDDLLARIHLSPSARNDEKMPAGELKHRVIDTIRRLEAAEASGRMVIDVARAQRCDPAADITLEDGDRLEVPGRQQDVTVVGEVYHAASHRYRPDLSSRDYIDLSGGITLLGRSEHAYVVQANGEVFSVRGGDWRGERLAVTVTPGSTIVVPIDVDRINDREAAQSWLEVISRVLTSAASLRVLFGGF